jgi:pimeloyl-ACP methyl ester carboxylesterase
MWWLAAVVLTTGADTRPILVAPAETLQVTLAGAGPPVVLVPGLFGSAYGFRHLTAALTARGYRVIVVEPLGVGGSSRPARADYSLSAQSRRIAAVLDSLQVRQALLVAHSLGAGMALRVAWRRPDLVRGVASLDGGPAPTAATPGVRTAARMAPWVKALGGVTLVRRKIRESLVRASGDTSWVTDEVVEGYTAGPAKDLDGTLLAFIRMAESREPERFESRLGEIRCPVRLMLGGAPHPEAVRDDAVALLSRRLERFAVDSVAGAGHHLHEERPDAVLATVEKLDAAPAVAGALP